MSAQLILTGMLPFVVLLASALAFPVCYLLLRIYRTAVVRGMAALSGGAAVAPESRPAVRAPAAALEFVSLDPAMPPPPPRTTAAAAALATRGPWRTAAAYAVAGLAYSLVMTSGWLLATADDTVVWTKVLILAWTYLWPAALAAAIVAAYDTPRRVLLFGGYFAVFALLVSVIMVRNPGLGMTSLPLYWVITNGPSTVLLATFLCRRIRAVGPLVLAFLLVLSVGSQSVVSLAAASDEFLRAVAAVGFALGLGARGTFIAMTLTGTIAFALCGWPLLRWLGKRYEAKKFSDQSITVDALWIVFAVVQSTGLAFEGAPWILTGAVAFCAYKLVSRPAVAWAQRGAAQASPKTLLLLRVFALARRSERLFDKLRKHWLFAGPVAMIAGPDLVTTTVEPHEFLDFVSGRLSRQFVTGQDDLDRRLRRVDRARDPDGRYRISEFFCHSDTWQMTMIRLAATSDAVVMDLRSFAPANQGCVFELGQLVDSVDLGRVVFLIDETTDREFLEDTLRGLWQVMSAESPNQVAAASSVRLFRVRRQSQPELKALVRLLLEDRAT